jgi:hypothetical protein
MEHKLLIKRFLGSIIDKILILILFVITGLAISPYGFPGKLGTFTGGVLENSPSSYQVTESVSKSTYSLLSIDLNIISLFIAVNIVYYIVWELFLKASLGKYIFRLRVVKEVNNDKFVDIWDVLYRGTVALGLMVGVVFIRFQLDINYVITMIIYFAILDIPVLFFGKSAIDHISVTKYINKKNENK